MIDKKLKILIVEDNPNDARLIDYHVRRIVSMPEIMAVDSFEAFEHAVKTNLPDIILSDYKLKTFTGMEVLEYVIEKTNISNFIFITGTIYDEELAAQTILSGATGYILKKNMSILSTKLLPYFEKIASTPVRHAPKDHEVVLTTINAFLNNTHKENQIHIDSYNQIKEAIERIKSLDK